MHSIKLQFEIRYKHILDYHKHNRVLIAPLLKREDASVSIENVDTINEFIIVRYPELGITIDFRIDRLLIICEGDQHKFEKQNGSIKHIFDLYERVKKLETFAMPTLVVLGFWGVRIVDKTNEEIRNQLAKNHLSKLGDLLSMNDDIAITIEKGSKNNKDHDRLDFGPFSKEDLTKHNIVLNYPERNEEVEDKNGILVKYVSSKKTKEINFNTYLSQYKKLKKVITNINKLNLG